MQMQLFLTLAVNPSSLYASESNPTRNRQPPRSRRIISVARLENSKFSPLRHQQRNRKSATPHSPSAVGSRQRHSSPRFHSPMKASAAAASPPPPPPRGWLSGLVSGAGRLLAAILDPESSASDTTSSSPESSQSPPRRDQATAGHGIGKCFPSDSHQLNLSGKEIVLKDSGEGSLAIVSEVHPKDAVKQLLMQETYSWSECDALIKIIQERVVDSDDEPAAILPIAWHANTQLHPVAHSSNPNTTAVPAVSNPACRLEFDNIVEKEWLKKSSAVAENRCTNSHDQIQHAMKRSYSNTGDTIEESRRIRPKRNRSNSLRNQGASSKEAATNASSARREFPEGFRTLFKDNPLLGTNNLTFSDLVSKGLFDDEPSVAAAAEHFTSTSCQADWDKRGSGMSYPYSSQNQMEMSRVKAELIDEPVALETDMTNMVQKNDKLIVRNGSCSVPNKTVFQGDIEAAPSSPMGLQTEKSSRNCTRGFNLQNIPTKRRSPASRNLPSNNGNGKTVRSWNGPPRQSNSAAGQESEMGRVKAKRPVGRPRKVRR
ncbi:hypothetical protein ZEAMMB73_Zm00001d015457 [Zea mays]|nr:hypothetical protein ZEAMMB73_Zm00001d015457 [Zea mays]